MICHMGELWKMEKCKRCICPHQKEPKQCYSLVYYFVYYSVIRDLVEGVVICFCPCSTKLGHWKINKWAAKQLMQRGGPKSISVYNIGGNQHLNCKSPAFARNTRLVYQFQHQLASLQPIQFTACDIRLWLTVLALQKFHLAGVPWNQWCLQLSCLITSTTKYLLDNQKMCLGMSCPRKCYPLWISSALQSTFNKISSTKVST